MLRLMVLSSSFLILSLAFMKNWQKKPFRNESLFKEATCIDKSHKCTESLNIKTKTSDIFLREQKRKKKIAYA